MKTGTPGPWEADGHLIKAHGVMIAQVVYNARTTKDIREMDANAQLIAKAWLLPELMKISTAILLRCEKVSFDPRTEDLFERLKQTLAKLKETK